MSIETNIPTLPTVETNMDATPNLHPVLDAAPVEQQRLDATHANVNIDVEGRTFQTTAPYKVFSSGSKGFYGNGKLDMGDGRRYQIGVTITRIGSKND